MGGTTPTTQPPNVQCTACIANHEHLRDSSSPSLRAPADYRFEAVVSVVEPMGAESLLIVSIGGVDLRVRLEGRNYPATGARIAVAIDPAEVQLFDATTSVSLRRREG